MPLCCINSKGQWATLLFNFSPERQELWQTASHYIACIHWSLTDERLISMRDSTMRVTGRFLSTKAGYRTSEVWVINMLFKILSIPIYSLPFTLHVHFVRTLLCGHWILIMHDFCATSLCGSPLSHFLFQENEKKKRSRLKELLRSKARLAAGRTSVRPLLVG